MTKHICCLLLILTLLCSPALAAFNSSGLETFSGTTLDTATWQAINPQLISQNNGLIMNAANPANEAQYTSDYAEVNVGGSAEVQVIISAHNSNNIYAQDVLLGLMTNDGSSAFIYSGELTYALFTQAEVNPLDTGYSGWFSAGQTNQGLGNLEGILLNQPITLGLDRLSASSVEYTAMNGVGQTVWSETENWSFGYSGPLFVAIGASSVTAEFSNLQLGGNFAYIPEPAPGMLLSIGSMVLLGRRRSK